MFKKNADLVAVGSPYHPSPFLATAPLQGDPLLVDSSGAFKGTRVQRPYAGKTLVPVTAKLSKIPFQEESNLDSPSLPSALIILSVAVNPV